MLPEDGANPALIIALPPIGPPFRVPSFPSHATGSVSGRSLGAFVGATRRHTRASRPGFQQREVIGCRSLVDRQNHPGIIGALQPDHLHFVRDGLNE